MQYDAIFFLGHPGSGKGTQARILSEKLDFFYFEMGATLREYAKQDTPQGRRTKELLASGVLFTDEDLIPVVTERLGTLPSDRGIVFEGIPRRRGQGEF